MDDSDIVERIWNRDEAALGVTDSRYSAYCRAIAMNILGDERDAEECVNDTWLRVWNSIPPERPRVFRAFLAKITRNIAFDRYRRKHAKKRGGAETAAALEELSECVSGESVENFVITKELSECINKFLGSLSERDRRIFMSRYFYVETTDEIAERHALTSGNVLMILSRTRKKLRAHLETEGYL